MKTFQPFKAVLFAVLCCHLSSAPAFADEVRTYQIISDKSPVTFLAVGKPGFLRIKGQGTHLLGTAEIKDGKLSGKFTVPLAGLKTGISLRDSHMHEKYLETTRFPQAELIIEPFPFLSQGEKIPFTGMLTIKGTSKPVKGEVQVYGLSEQASGRAEFNVLINDFPNIGVPSYLGVTIAEQVQVVVEFTASTMAPQK